MEFLWNGFQRITIDFRRSKVYEKQQLLDQIPGYPFNAWESEAKEHIKYSSENDIFNSIRRLNLAIIRKTHSNVLRDLLR